MLSEADVISLNDLFARTSPEKIVQWAAAQFGQDLVMSSSFGADSAVLLHMATQVKPDIRVIMIDTGYLFPETFAFMETLRRRLNLNVWIYRTRHDPIAYLAQVGEGDPQWRKEIESCCAANKNEPFDRAMRDLAPSAWLRGIRRAQATTRAQKPFVEWSRRNNCYAVSPLLNWTGREVHQYLQAHDLPYHPLRDKGYLSIGCNPQSCTRPIQPGEDERSGRWSGTGKVECGINLSSLDSSGL